MTEPFTPTHDFTLLDGTVVPVAVELRGDPVAEEADGTRWATVCGPLELWWTCRKRGVVKLRRVTERGA